MRFRPLLSPFVLLLFLSCQKTKVTPPATPAPVTTELSKGYTSNSKSINGYFYAYCIPALNGNVDISAYCAFRDPAGDLMANFNRYTNSRANANGNNEFGNIQVNQVSLNNLPLIKFNNGVSEISYQLYNGHENNFNYSASWHTDGNGTFKGVDVTIPGDFPKIITQTAQGNTITYTTRAGYGYVLDFSNQISNFDSLVVTLGYSIAAEGSVTKRLSGSAKSVAFTWEELDSYAVFGNSVPIVFMAFNYSNKTVANKVYVFELATSFNTTIFTTSSALLR